jgi:excisionase family DNA binding protein
MTFQAWCRQQLAWLDAQKREQGDFTLYDDCESIIREAQKRASEAGLPDAVKASSLKDGPKTPAHVRQCLASCIQAISAKAELLSVETVATMLDVSTSHVRRLRDGGKLPKGRKVGGSIRWPRQDIEAYINGLSLQKIQRQAAASRR